MFFEKNQFRKKISKSKIHIKKSKIKKSKNQKIKKSKSKSKNQNQNQNQKIQKKIAKKKPFTNDLALIETSSWRCEQKTAASAITVVASARVSFN